MDVDIFLTLDPCHIVSSLQLCLNPVGRGGGSGDLYREWGELRRAGWKREGVEEEEYLERRKTHQGQQRERKHHFSS